MHSSSVMFRVVFLGTPTWQMFCRLVRRSFCRSSTLESTLLCPLCVVDLRCTLGLPLGLGLLAVLSLLTVLSHVRPHDANLTLTKQGWF